jgi:hypothetical protein
MIVKVQFNNIFRKDYVHNQKERDHFKEVIVDGRIILKWTSKKFGDLTDLA